MSGELEARVYMRAIDCMRNVHLPSELPFTLFEGLSKVSLVALYVCVLSLMSLPGDTCVAWKHRWLLPIMLLRGLAEGVELPPDACNILATLFVDSQGIETIAVKAYFPSLGAFKIKLNHVVYDVFFRGGWFS